MALFIGNTLAKNGIFNTADLEAAFHPWWKTVQDYVCYSGIIIGKLVIIAQIFEWHHHGTKYLSDLIIKQPSLHIGFPLPNNDISLSTSSFRFDV